MPDRVTEQIDTEFEFNIGDIVFCKADGKDTFRTFMVYEQGVTRGIAGEWVNTYYGRANTSYEVIRFAEFEIRISNY